MIPDVAPAYYRRMNRVVGAAALVVWGAGCGGSAPRAKQPGQEEPSETQHAAQPSSQLTLDHQVGMVGPQPSRLPDPPPLDCSEQRKSDNAVLVTSERALQRRGSEDHRFSDTVTSYDKPIEVCGFWASLKWLTKMTCDDGSYRWGTSTKAAHDARRGAGMGDDIMGNCMRMVDHYVAPCPEGEHDVYINVYVCTEGEDLYENWHRP